MSTVLEALGDPTIRSWYLGFGFALMVLPMVGLSWWYHTTIRRTEGGRRLMQRQAETPPLSHNAPGQAPRTLVQAGAMARDIASGEYGEAARTMQKKVYWIVGLWLLANALVFGLLIGADEWNRGGSGDRAESTSRLTS